MKRFLFLSIILLSLLLSSCKTKNAEAEMDNSAISTEQENPKKSGNPYISKTQSEDTPVVEENLSGEVTVLSASEVINKVTDIYDDKGFRYKGYTPCVVDFYADWCNPCQSIKPMMIEMARKYKGKLIIYKINVDHARDICDAFDIESIPTLIFFNRTEQPRKMVGAPSKRDLENTIVDFLSK